MEIVWDERKREANFQAHHLDFAEIEHFDWNSAAIGDAHTGRFKAIGVLGTRVVAVIFAMRGTEGISIVSLRPASKSERRQYGTR